MIHTIFPNEKVETSIRQLGANIRADGKLQPLRSDAKIARTLRMELSGAPRCRVSSTSGTRIAC